MDRIETLFDSMMVAYQEPDPEILKQWYDGAKSMRRLLQTGKWISGGSFAAKQSSTESNTYRRVTSADKRAFAAWCAHRGLGDLRSPETDKASDIINFTLEGENSQAASIGLTVKAATTRRRFFVSEAGKMGMAPQTAGQAATKLFGMTKYS